MRAGFTGRRGAPMAIFGLKRLSGKYDSGRERFEIGA